jgi:adenine C2-methylase RlmN of 23S rRNA A2503 and tRNA A37
MRISSKYNLDMFLTMLREEIVRIHKLKVLFECVMLVGINDSLYDARKLVNLVEGTPCKINIISSIIMKYHCSFPILKKRWYHFTKIKISYFYLS